MDLEHESTERDSTSEHPQNIRSTDEIPFGILDFQPDRSHSPVDILMDALSCVDLDFCCDYDCELQLCEPTLPDSNPSPTQNNRQATPHSTFTISQKDILEESKKFDQKILSVQENLVASKKRILKGKPQEISKVTSNLICSNFRLSHDFSNFCGKIKKFSVHYTHLERDVNW